MRFMLAGAVLLVAAAAQALEERIPVVRAAVLEAPRGGETRFLLDIGSLDAVRNERILSARMRIPLPGVILGQELPVDLYGLTTSRRGAVPTWTTPWTTPGGDLDPGPAAYRGLEEGDRKLSAYGIRDGGRERMERRRQAAVIEGGRGGG
ncbi:MAG: hypothetical protein ACRDGR_10000 [bacterium]